jgi:hypothetical protein
MKRYIAIIAIIFGIVLFAVVVKAVNDSYRINKTASSIINEQGSCRGVTNNSATYDYFIPTKTLTEWNLFKQNKPADVSLNSCYQCPTTSSVYDNQTTCNNACTQTGNCTSNNNISYCKSLNVQGYHCSDGGGPLVYVCSWGDCNVGYSENCSGGSLTSIGAGGERSGTYNTPECGDGNTYSEYSSEYYRKTITTYSCPLAGGSACSGSPQTCTASQNCNLYNQ